MLTKLACDRAKPKDKPYKLADGGGLYLEVQTSGSKLWRLKYRFAGKENRASFGAYPELSLPAARAKRAEIKAQIKAGTDPNHKRAIQKAAIHERAANSFEVIALEWHAMGEAKWTPGTAERIKRRLELNVFPWLGSRPIADITAPELLAVVRRTESRGAVDTSHRVLQNCGQVFRYAIATGRAQMDLSTVLRGALKPVQVTHHASVKAPTEIGKLLRDMDGYSGTFVTKCALRLAPLVFVRPGELRAAEWAEFDLDAAEWRIPAARMKMKDPHVVPLSVQAVAILKELQPLTGSARYLFPGARSNARPMSENTVNAALRYLGYTNDVMTGHGFRSMASTRLNEMGWKHDVIERQLAHGERDKVRAAYNHAQYLEERREMMQAWADYLDSLRRGDSKVVPMARRNPAG